MYAPEHGAKFGLIDQHLDEPGHVVSTPVGPNPGARAGITNGGETLKSMMPDATLSPAVDRKKDSKR